MKLFLAAVSFLVLFSCGASTELYAPPESNKYPGTIEGKVIDKDGNLIRNALIGIEGRKLKVRTDKDGKFLIRGLEKGEYKIQCNMDGFSKKIKDEVLVKGKYITVINFVLNKK